MSKVSHAQASFSPLALATDQDVLAQRLGIFNAAGLPAFHGAIAKTSRLITRKVAAADAPFTGIAPFELAERFASVDLDVPLDSFDHALAELESLYLKDAVYFHHPRYLAHLNPPVNYPAIAAELIQAAINTAVETWDQSAGGTLIERALIDWTLGRIGLDSSRGDGVFTAGGTQSNLMALLLARDHYCKAHLNGHSVQRHGLPPQAGRFRILASAASHFSVQKAAALLGLGFDAVIPVAVDAQFRMDVTALARALVDCQARDEIPIAVVATLGTTDLGSIDPIADIAPLCRAHGIWLHADAAYGCGLLVSNRYRERLGQIDCADSVTVDYHKSFLQPVSCSAFLVKQRQHLECVAYHADYLNPQSQMLEGIPDQVHKSLQTTRRFDALKLWLTLRVSGPQSVGEAFDMVIDLAAAAHGIMAEDVNLELLHTPTLSTLVFRYRPIDAIDDEILNHINSAIRKKLCRNSEAMIASTRIDGRVYLKFTLLNPCVTVDDVLAVVQRIKVCGQAILDERQAQSSHSPSLEIA